MKDLIRRTVFKDLNLKETFKGTFSFDEFLSQRELLEDLKQMIYIKNDDVKFTIMKVIGKMRKNDKR